MWTKQSVIGGEARNVLEGHIDNYFGSVKDGEDLDSVVAEVLKDRDLFDFLMINLEEGKGLRVGYIYDFDDIAFYRHYGLTLDLNVPRKIKMFGFESLDPGVFAYEKTLKKTLRVRSCFPYTNISSVESSEKLRPSVEDFCNNLNMHLQDPFKYVIQLPSN
ncbi:hypothetical protein HOE04_05485 [archaeon]|mgnify:CR=1 FL=1|jgi:hypothetical protein|nr:hypothetical protein [archaeon]